MNTPSYDAVADLLQEHSVQEARLVAMRIEEEAERIKALVLIERTTIPFPEQVA